MDYADKIYQSKYPFDFKCGYKKNRLYLLSYCQQSLVLTQKNISGLLASYISKGIRVPTLKTS